MPQAEQQATKRYTVLDPIENIRLQIDVAKETPQLPIVLQIESEIGNESTLHLFYKHLDPGADEDELFAESERQESVSVFIPHHPEARACVYLPN